MKVTSKTIWTATAGLFAISVLSAALAATSIAEDIQEKTITSKQSGNLVVAITNKAGELTPGENHFCVLFKSISPSTPIDIQEVSVDFKLFVGRIVHVPKTAHLSSNGTQKFCGGIDLGQQYYRPANYYVLVHSVDATGKKRSTRLSLAVK